MSNPGATKRTTRSVSETDEMRQPSTKTKRKSRSVLNDVSNRRQTRSLAAKAGTKPAKAGTRPVSAHKEQAQQGTRRLSHRRSSRNSKEPSELQVDQVPAKSRGRKPAAKKEPEKIIRSKSTSRSRSKPKSATPPISKDPVPKKTRGRSKTSRKEPDATESKATRATKRSRMQDDATEQPARKTARASSTNQPKRTTRSRSGSKGEINKLVGKRLDADLRLEADQHNLVRSLPFDPCKFTDGLSVYDTPSRDNVLEAPEYVSDIFQRLYHAETKSRPHPYMHNQQSLTTTMRAILIDWLVEVHMKFRLVPETLYLGVNILDRYLSLVQIDRAQLQLVGVTSLFIACKYEEIYPPEVRDCVYITDRGFTRQQVLDMETAILNNLEFKISVPTGHPFLHRFLFITQATELVSIAATYYMERVLQEHDFLAFRPSVIAAAAVCLALNHPEIRQGDNLSEDGPGMPPKLLEYTGYSTEKILQVAKLMAAKVKEAVVTISKRDLVAVKRKYDEACYFYVSADFGLPHVSDISCDY